MRPILKTSEIPSLPLLALFLCALLAGCGPNVEKRMQTAASSNDQSVLAKMAIKDKDDGVRRTAAARLTDQAALAEVAVKGGDPQVRKTAAGKLVDQASLGRVALESWDTGICMEAVGKLTDQAFLGKVSLNSRHKEVRDAAVGKLTDQATLYRVACDEKELPIRTLAIGRMTDQPLLARLASEQPAAAIRLAAVAQVTDDDFLLQRSRVDSSNAVRMGAVEAMRKDTHLARVAVENDSREQREIAGRRVKNPALRRQVDMANQGRAKELAAIERQADEGALAQSALQGRFDVIRLAAARRLRQQAILGKVAGETGDREVCKIVFGKLTDRNALLGVAGNARDNAVRTAATVKAGQTTWKKVFEKASGKGAGPVVLGEALAAVDLFPEKQADAKDGVVEACLNFIRRGDETRIPELADMLDLYGDKKLGEDYLNCGQPDLNAAAHAWAGKHGYNVGKGAGSHRAKWGSNRN